MFTTPWKKLFAKICWLQADQGTYCTNILRLGFTTSLFTKTMLEICKYSSSLGQVFQDIMANNILQGDDHLTFDGGRGAISGQQ